MKILIDMNLLPMWVKVLRQEGWEAHHWSTIGASNAPDSEILVWARQNRHIVFSHDLDFGAILAATQARSPSVIQVRTQDVSPSSMKGLLLNALKRFRSELESGALIVIDDRKSRVRILPIVSR